MIVGNMATYPARASVLQASVLSIIDQVDVLNVILNEYTTEPGWLRDYPRASAIIPSADTKDTGKFWCAAPSPNDWLFTLDDDIIYPPDYVTRTLDQMVSLDLGDFVGGYHGSIYRRPRLLPSNPRLRRLLLADPNYIVSARDDYCYWEAHERATIVEQIGTGTSVMRARHAPPYSAVGTAQRFIDVRFARWCHQQGVSIVCLARPAGWLREAGPMTGDSIFRSFTLERPAHVADEIRRFAHRVPNAGQPAAHASR